MKEHTRHIGLFINITLVALALAGAAIVVMNLAVVASERGVFTKQKRVAIVYRSALISPMVDGFVNKMKTLGWSEGKKVQYQWFLSYDDAQLLDFQARQVAAGKFDAVVAIGGPTAEAIKKFTSTEPTAFYTIEDPITEGLIESYHGSGNNFVGVGGSEVAARQVETLEELHHMSAGLGVLVFGSEPTSNASFALIDVAAKNDNVKIVKENITGDSDVVKAFADLKDHGIETVYITSGPSGNLMTGAIVAEAIAQKMILMGALRTIVQAGALLSVNVDTASVGEQLGKFVDQILRGTSPKDISSELPNKSFVALNKKTADSIGITIPQDLINEADLVVQ